MTEKCSECGCDLGVEEEVICTECVLDVMEDEDLIYDDYDYIQGTDFDPDEYLSLLDQQEDD